MGMVVVIGIGVTLSALVIQGVASGLGVAAEGALVGRRFTGRSLWRNGLATLMLPSGAGPMSPGWPLWNLTQAMTLVVAAVALLVSWPASPAAQSKSAAVGVERLVGRWVRPDGGYVLDIRGAEPGGRLEAAYLNPRPINVARAEWRREEGRLLVSVELRDVNYPGSTYNLRYLPDGDRLVGDYYQAVQKRTFDVEFVRQK